MTVSDPSLDFLDAIDIPAFVLDVEDEADFRFVMINAAHERTTGLDRSALAGKRPQDFLPGRMAETVTANYRRCLANRASYTYEECLELPRGPLWWQTTLSPFFDDGRLVRIVGMAIDITERKQSEFSAAESRDKIKQLNDELNAVASAAAHDLRGPLRQISIVAEVLHDGFKDLGDGKKELLETISDMTGKALYQIDEVLSYQRSLALGQATLSDCDLNRICSDIVTLLDPMYEKRVDYPQCTVKADRPALQLALRNLFDNAFKYCEDAVELRLDVESQPGWLKFTMADDGAGFDPIRYPVGLPPALPDRATLGGIGLSAVRRIAEARGGKVRVEKPLLGNGGAISVTFQGQLA